MLIQQGVSLLINQAGKERATDTERVSTDDNAFQLFMDAAFFTAPPLDVIPHGDNPEESTSASELLQDNAHASSNASQDADLVLQAPEPVVPLSAEENIPSVVPATIRMPMMAPIVTSHMENPEPDTALYQTASVGADAPDPLLLQPIVEPEVATRPVLAHEEDKPGYTMTRLMQDVMAMPPAVSTYANNPLIADKSHYSDNDNALLEPAAWVIDTAVFSKAESTGRQEYKSPALGHNDLPEAHMALDAGEVRQPYIPRWHVSPTEHKAALSLYRPDLGHIKADISVDQQQSTVTLLTESQETRHILSAQLAQLKDVFSDANLLLVEAHVEQQHSQQSPSDRRHPQSDAERGQYTISADVEGEPSPIVSVHQPTSLIDAYV